MVDLRVDGEPVALARVGTNDGLNYGRFDAPGIEIHRYELAASADEVISAMSAAFDALVAEMRTDDLLEDEPSALMRMGYPTLREAFRWPDDLREVLDVFLHVDLLATFAPFTPGSAFVINSTDEIVVHASGLRIVGRCFRRSR